ncbi:MAG: type II secretion system protein [Phycisphaerae bacterium]
MPSQHTPSPIHRKSAFTLIELLVVVAIIAVLIAILLPSLGRARDKAKSAACLSNLKSMSLAYNMYCNDANNGFTAVDDTSIAGCIWMFQMQNYLGGNNVRGLTQGQQVSGNVFFCPSANMSAPSGHNTEGGGSNFWGSASLAWDGHFDASGVWDKAINPGELTSASAVSSKNPMGYLDLNGNAIDPATSPGYRSSYGLNSWLDARYPYGNKGQQGVGSSGGHTSKNTMPPNYVDMRRVANIAQPDTTPLLADMIWVNSDAKTSGSNCYGVVPTDYGPNSASATPPTQLDGNTASALGRMFIDRHDKAINVGFLGGNASTVKLAELTQLDWYNGATRTTLAANWRNVLNK